MRNEVINLARPDLRATHGTRAAPKKDPDMPVGRMSTSEQAQDRICVLVGDDDKFFRYSNVVMSHQSAR